MSPVRRPAGGNGQGGPRGAGRGGDRRWTWEAALAGIVPPVISPLDPTREVDEPAVAQLVEHVLAAGASGLFVLGGCGEGAWLAPRSRARVVRAMARAAAGRVPVLAGVMLPATGPAVEAARDAAGEGADALVVGSPYYFGVDASAHRRHVETVLEAGRLPVLLYNIPQCTHQTLSPATVATLARDSRVLGIKDSAGDFEAFLGFVGVKRRRADFRVLQGNEYLAAASLLQGGDGLVPGLANVAPALFVALRRAAAAGDAATCARIQEQVRDLATLYAAAGHWLPALKAACALLGIGAGVPGRPLEPAGERERRRVGAVLRRHGLLGRPARGAAGARRRAGAARP